MGKFRWLTALCIGLLVMFGFADATAHITKYQYGETFSAFLWALEKRSWVARIVVGAAVLTLFTHLEFHTP